MAKRQTRRKTAVQQESPSPPVAAPRSDILDKSRPFGTITGEFFVRGKRVAYEVAISGHPSKLYGINYERIYRDDAEERAGTVRRGRPPNAARVANQPTPPNLDNDEDDDTPPMQIPEELAGDIEGVETTSDGEVNLTAWAKGEVKYRFARVRDAISERYNREVTNEDDALETLMDAKVVTVADVKAGREGA